LNIGWPSKLSFDRDQIAIADFDFAAEHFDRLAGHHPVG
jgi:hypothetical protein